MGAMQDDLERILGVVGEVAGLPQLGPDDDFYRCAGLSSIRALWLLFELELTFGIHIPDDEFIAARTPRALCGVVRRVVDGGSA